MRLLLLTIALLCIPTRGQRLTEKEDEEARHECGIFQRAPRVSFKVVNGSRVKWEDAPWTVKAGPNASGAWISRRHILTAAHVISTLFSCDGSNVDKISIIYDYLGVNSTEEATFTFKIKRHFMAKGYAETDCTMGDNFCTYDIAILEIDIPADIKIPYVYTCLPEERLRNLTMLHVYGYGNTKYMEYSPFLHTFNSTAYIESEVENSDRMRFYNSEQTSCYGDSGGGVVEFDSKGVATIQALVSGGDGDCNPTKRDQRYTMVHPYMDGICAITGRCKSAEHRASVDQNLEEASGQFIELFTRKN